MACGLKSLVALLLLDMRREVVSVWETFTLTQEKIYDFLEATVRIAIVVSTITATVRAKPLFRATSIYVLRFDKFFAG